MTPTSSARETTRSGSLDLQRLEAPTADDRSSARNMVVAWLLVQLLIYVPVATLLESRVFTTHPTADGFVYGTTAIAAGAMLLTGHYVETFLVLLTVLHGFAHRFFPFLDEEKGYCKEYDAYIDIFMHTVHVYVYCHIQESRKWVWNGWDQPITIDTPVTWQHAVNICNKILLVLNAANVFMSYLHHHPVYGINVEECFVFLSLFNGIGAGCFYATVLLHDEHPAEKQSWTPKVVLLTSVGRGALRWLPGFYLLGAKMRFYELTFMVAAWLCAGKIFVCDMMGYNVVRRKAIRAHANHLGITSAGAMFEVLDHKDLNKDQ